MGIWRRLGRIGWLAAKGSWRLHRAGSASISTASDAGTASKAGRSSAGFRSSHSATSTEVAGNQGRTSAEPGVDAWLTSRQAVLLARYVAGTFVLSWLELFFLLKYLVLIGGIILVRVDEFRAVGVVLLALFVTGAVGQWFVTRMIRRLGAIDRLAELDDIVATGSTSWWPKLKRELRRVGLSPSPWGILGLGAGVATGRLSREQLAALARIDWLTVLPREEWRRARQVLARAAGPAPATGGQPLPGERPSRLEQPR